MELIHAALLLHSAGKDVSEDNVRNIVDAADIEVEDAEIKALISALDGVDIDDAVQQSVNVGAPAAAQQQAEAQDADEEDEAAEDEDDEAPEDEEPAADEEEAAEGLGSLF